MTWHAWVWGTIAFDGEKSVRAWQRAPLVPTRDPALPAWLSPPRSSIGTVALELSEAKQWSRSFEKYLHLPDRVAIEVGAETTVRAYLRGLYGSHFLGAIAAIVVAAARAKGRGEIGFVEIGASRGHRVVLDGAGGVASEPLDLVANPALAKAYADVAPWVQKAARVKLGALDRPSEPPKRIGDVPEHPFRKVHLAAGARDAATPLDETFDVPTHGNLDAEIAHLERDYGVIDLSHHARIGLRNSAGHELVIRAAPGLEVLETGTGRDAVLADAHGAFDHAIVHRSVPGAVDVIASPGTEPALSAWFRALAEKNAFKGDRKVQIGDGYGAYSPRIAFVGPEAASFAKTVKTPGGTFHADLGAWLGHPALLLGGEARVLAPILEAHRAHLCGSAALQHVLQAKRVVTQAISIGRPDPFATTP